jgi:hypothetical protein
MRTDNSTLVKKTALRRQALKLLPAPVVMETHGGTGQIYRRCYAHIDTGVVFERDPRKARVLGLQRPTWAVYRADCVAAIRAGVGGHLPVNFFDLDPWGEPWPAIEAIFSGGLDLPGRIVFAVNDVLRLTLKRGAWRVRSMADAVTKFGNDIYHRYLEVARWKLERIAAEVGFTLERFGGYYCGVQQQNAHYYALLRRDG